MPHYQKINRETQLFVEGSLDSLLPATSVARSIWAVLSSLDFSAYDLAYKNDDVGRPALDPRSLTAVWLLALLRGDTAATRLASLCRRDIEYRWLLGGVTVEKSLLSDFRKDHTEALVTLGSQTLTALSAEGLLPGKQIGIDGTVVRAAASRHANKSRKGLIKQAKRLEAVLREKLESSEAPDSALVEVLEKRLAKARESLDYMTSHGLIRDKDTVTVTEPSARLLRQKDGSYAPGYNVQATLDLDSGAVIHAQVAEGGSDSGQLQSQVEKAEAVLKQQAPEGEATALEAVTADAAYHDVRQLAHLEERGVACFVPEDRNAHRVPPGIAPEYRASAFVYNEADDTLTCPQQRVLKRYGFNARKTSARYRAKACDCIQCPTKALCCPGGTRNGRQVNRTLYPETLKTVSERVQSEEGRWMRRARSVVCEGAMARMQHLLHWKRCRMRGREGMEAELQWRGLANNLMLLAGLWKPLVLERSAA